MTFEHPERGVDAVYAPRFVCDVCGEAIDDARLANAQCYVDGFCGPPTTGEVFTVHKGACQRRFDAQFEGGRWTGKAGWMPLEKLVAALANNTQVDVAAVQEQMRG
jgi:hypothetical protein